MLRYLVTLTILLLGINSYSQGKVVNISLAHSCAWDGRPVTGIIHEYQSDNDALEVINTIVNAIGLQPNFSIRASDVPTALSTNDNGERIIFYNLSFLQKVDRECNTNWASMSVLAHEVGHHYNNDPLDGGSGRIYFELTADEFSGFVLHKLGASLEEAQTAANKFLPNEGSSTYPPKSSRLKAIEKGWRKDEPEVPDNYLINVNGYNQINIDELKPDTHNNNTIWDVTQFSDKAHAKKLLQCIEGYYSFDLDIPPKDFSIIRNNSSMQIQIQDQTVLTASLKIDILYKRQGISQMEYFQIKGNATGYLNISTNSDKRHIIFGGAFTDPNKKTTIMADKFPKLIISEIPLNGEFIYNTGSSQNKFYDYKTKKWSNNILYFENYISGLWTASIVPDDLDNDAMLDLKFFKQ